MCTFQQIVICINLRKSNHFVLTCETPAGLKTWLIRLLASNGGWSWGALVVGGAGVVMGSSDPNYKKEVISLILRLNKETFK